MFVFDVSGGHESLRQAWRDETFQTNTIVLDCFAVPGSRDTDALSLVCDLWALQRRPAVLRGVGLGPCLEKWTVEYLAQKGGDKEVKIHVSTMPQMDFLRKNFAYK